MNTLLLNDLVVMPDGLRHRILAVTNSGQDAWVIATEERCALPAKVSYTWLSANCKQVTPSDKATSALVTTKSATASAKALKRRDVAWERIAPLVANARIFEPTARAQLLRQRARELACSENTLLLNLRRYWQRGQNLDALLPDYSNRGQATAGRRTADGRAPFALTDADRKALDKAITGYYLKKEYHTLTDAYQWMLERHYTFKDGNNDSFIKAPEERPSLRQLQLWLKKNYSLEHRLRARKGNKDFERDHRHSLGSIQLDCHGAGHMFEIDATIVDSYLVSSSDPTAIVGKPTLYLIIDRATRLIVGWYVGFENACWSAAMQAILSIAENKEEICQRYGVKYDPADWPAHGIQPELFLADQGEMASKNARRISSGLRSMVCNVPGLRPDWKPLVECGFKMIHQLISPGLPAYDPPSNQKRRRGKAYHRDACLTLDDFTALIVKAIVTHNNTMQVNFDSSIEQVAAGVRPIPTELWTFEARNRVGALARFDANTVRMELLPQEKATVTLEGIVLRNCLYTFTEGAKNGWFVQARRKRFSVDVSLDYRMCDEVIVHDPDAPGKVYIAELVDGCKKFSGMSFADVKRHTDAKARLTADAEPIKRQNQFELHQHSAPIVKAAEERLKAATGGNRLSRSARKKDVSSARLNDLSMERANKAGMPALPPIPMPPAQQPTRPAPVVASNQIEVPAAAPRSLSLKEIAAQQRKKLLAAAA